MTLLSIVGVVALCSAAFAGSFTESIPVTVVAPRAGLVMNPGAKVEMLGVLVGRVASIEERPNEQAALHLAMQPGSMHLIPANIAAEITSPTVFGAKYVRLVPPASPTPGSLTANTVLAAGQVTVEIDTVFQKLTSLLSSIDPTKLNATMAAVAAAVKGHGPQIGQTFVDLDAVLARVQPALPALEHDASITSTVLRAYADAAPDLMTILANTSRVGRTVTNQQRQLDTLLISAAGLGDIGADVLGSNRQRLTDVLRLAVPTTDVLNRYHEGIHCGLAGFVPVSESPASPVPGVVASLSFKLGIERYRYPSNLPKVAATGDPHCAAIGLPNLPFQFKPKFVVGDIGANPWQYANPGIVPNSDALKQFLFGPLDGPPRNTAQIGQPG